MSVLHAKPQNALVLILKLDTEDHSRDIYTVFEMVNESWLGVLWRSSSNKVLEPEKLVIGILAYEVSNFMSKIIHLWQSLSDKQVVRLREEVMNSEGIRKLVSGDEDFLSGLMFREIIENLEVLAKFVARLGRRCANPVLQRFDCVFNDLVQNNVDLYGLEYRLNKMEKRMKKMGRLIAVNASLSQELEVLAELEQTLRRMQRRNDSSQIGLLEFKQKVVWQRQEVKNLREYSLSNRTYDYTVRLLARSLFTIFRRINYVYGRHLEKVVKINDSPTLNANYLPRSHSFSTSMLASVHPSANDLARSSPSPLGGSYMKSGSFSSTNKVWMFNKPGLDSGTNMTRNVPCQIQNQSSAVDTEEPCRKVKRLAPVGPFFKGCMNSGNDSPVLHSFRRASTGHWKPNNVDSRVLNGPKDGNADSFSRSNRHHVNLPLFSSKQKVLDAPPFTLGVAALAVHYANIIVILEKLVTFHHLIGPDIRDDLYSRLPTSLRVALRARLKSYVKNSTSFVYETSLAAKWTEALTRILEWLAPLAHNMIRWQSARNLEQRHLVSRTNVLLVQTLYFADQAKTEAAITELLVGLNYLWRLGPELDVNASLDCARSRNLDSYL